MHRSPPIAADPADELGRNLSAARTELGLIVRSPKTEGPVLIAALTDLDGTVNDEHEPEHRRLATIGPAREALAVLEMDGIVTGICTARSVGEALHYRSALKLTGPLICENGAVLIFADGSRQVFGNLEQLEIAVGRISARIGRTMPHSLDWPGLEAAWEGERRGNTPVFLGHPDRESLRLAADRRASCFLVGLDSFGELLHLIPRGVNKGLALTVLLDHVRANFPNPDMNLAPLVFGNGENDLPLFEQAIKAGGAAVLVGDARADGGFHFDIVRRPPPSETITLPGISHGQAIRQSLPRLAHFFATQYGLRFPW